MILRRRFFVSPSIALSLAVVGFHSFGGFVNFLTPEGSAGYIFVRISILLVMLVAFALNLHKITIRFRLALTPTALFLGIYSFRLIENFFSQA